MELLISIVWMVSCVLAGPPAEWACKDLNQIAYKDASCVNSVQAVGSTFYVTTKKTAAPSTRMCIIEVSGEGVKPTKDFYLQTTITAPSNIAFAGISYHMEGHNKGDYIYFRLKVPSERNNFAEGYFEEGNIQTSHNYNHAGTKTGTVKLELLVNKGEESVLLNGVKHVEGSEYEPHTTKAGAIGIALPNYIGSNIKVAGLQMCSPVTCITPDGTTISGGESYTDDDGKKCTCRSTGQMECVCDVPLSPCPGGTSRWTDPDTCESKCIRGPQYCRSSGDPHYKTFDGKYYDFHGKCTYQAASCGEFEVFFKNYDLYGRAPRFTGRIELKFNNEEFAITNGFQAIVNGANVQIPYFKTYTNGDKVEIINNGQLEIRLYNKGRNPSVRLRANNAGRYVNAEMWLHGSCADITEGLCGNFNGNPNDDITNNNPWDHGEKYKEYDEHCPAPPKPYHACDDVPNGHAQAEEICSDLKKSPFAQCSNLVSIGTKEGGVLKDCMTDVCFCFLDNTCACDTYDIYATECLNKNPVDRDALLNWRKEVEYCPYKCPSGQTYMPDGKVPPPTCLNRNPEQTGVARGCFCTGGKILQDGQCIPENQCKCLYEGEFYQNGDKIVKEGECKVCTCRDGGEMPCEDMKCPELNCDDHEIVSYKPDKCCGFCNDNWVIAVNPENKIKKGQGLVLTCEIQAEGIFKKDITWYKDGKKITGGLSKDKRRLTIKDADRADGGKYTCQANKDGRIGSDDFNVEVIMPAICEHENGRTWEEGKIYKPSDTIECTCDAQGQHVCECVDDGVKCPEDKPIVWLDDECVKTCVPETGLCSAAADPHYKTFDGTEYDFKGDCKYVFFSCDDIAIYADHEKDRASTHTKSLELVYKQDTYKFEEGRVTLNGATVTIPMHKVYEALQLDISNVGNYIVTLKGNGLDPLIELKWDKQASYSVKAHGICKGSSKGLCGKWNDKPGDDFTSSDGKKTDNVEEFGTSWALDDEADCPVPPEPEDMCKTFGVDRAPHDTYVKKVLSAGVFKKCGAKVDSAATAENAVQEICLCFGDKTCACTIFEQYAEECAAQGIDTSDWKKTNKESVCTPDCDGGLSWNPRGPKPAPSCAKPQGGNKRQPGCFCPEGKVLQDNKCIDVKECKCEYGGEIYNIGQKYKVEAECKECTCVGAGKVDCGDLTCKTKCDDNEIEVEVEGECCPVCRADWVTAVNPDAKGKMKAALVLTCKVEGVQISKGNVKWFKFDPGNQDITNVKKTYSVSDDGLELTIKSMDDKKVGNYKCVVEKDGKSSEGVFEVSLPIEQEDLIQALNKEVNFVEGVKVDLEVQKVPGKAITEIYWVCNGERITAKTPGYKITNKAKYNRLTIESAQEKDKGSCTCFAKGIGTEDSEEITISGKAGSVTLTPMQSKVSCKTGKKGCRVGCTYETNGPDINQANTKVCKIVNGKDTECKSTKCDAGTQKCSITFGNKTPKTAEGTYACVTNINGKEIRSSNIDVTIKDKKKI